jgi:hypothetical protein
LKSPSVFLGNIHCGTCVINVFVQLSAGWQNILLANEFYIKFGPLYTPVWNYQILVIISQLTTCKVPFLGKLPGNAIANVAMKCLFHVFMIIWPNREEELHYRHQLQSAGLKRSDRMCVIDEPVQMSWKKRRTMDTSDEEDNVCEVSKKICYISMVSSHYSRSFMNRLRAALMGMNHDVTHQISGIMWRSKAKSTWHHLQCHTQLIEKAIKILMSCHVGRLAYLMGDVTGVPLRRSDTP